MKLQSSDTSVSYKLLIPSAPHSQVKGVKENTYINHIKKISTPTLLSLITWLY